MLFLEGLAFALVIYFIFNKEESLFEGNNTFVFKWIGIIIASILLLGLVVYGIYSWSNYYNTHQNIQIWWGRIYAGILIFIGFSLIHKFLRSLVKEKDDNKMNGVNKDYEINMNKDSFLKKLLLLIDDNNFWYLQYDKFYQNRNTEIFKIMRKISIKNYNNQDNVLNLENLDNKLFDIYNSDLKFKNFFDNVPVKKENKHKTM